MVERMGFLRDRNFVSLVYEVWESVDEGQFS